MSTARLIVCEKSGKWAVAFRRALGSEGPRVYETRTLVDCCELLSSHPASFVALELTAGNLGQVCQTLLDIRRRFRRAAAVTVAARSLRPCRWVLREAGAAYVVHSPRRLAPLVRMARLHLAAAPQQEHTLRQALLQRLPWSGDAEPVENH